jgi:hypothetical protein
MCAELQALHNDDEPFGVPPFTYKLPITSSSTRKYREVMTGEPAKTVFEVLCH